LASCVNDNYEDNEEDDYATLMVAVSIEWLIEIIKISSVIKNSPCVLTVLLLIS